MTPPEQAGRGQTASPARPSDRLTRWAARTRTEVWAYREVALAEMLAGIVTDRGVAEAILRSTWWWQRDDLSLAWAQLADAVAAELRKVRL